MTYVACSQWLDKQAKKSALLKDQIVTNIPNTIDTHVFCPQEKIPARLGLGLPEEKKLILFVSQRVTDLRKGVSHFIEAISILVQQHPDMANTTCIALLGGCAEEIAPQLALPAYSLGYVSDAQRIVQVYNAADVFVLPSLEDNLPNTIMEAMACGVPCVGFKVGGIPEEIDHQKNGYVAAYRDAQDLARGLHWVLAEADYEALSKAAVTKVKRCYSQQSVALKYTEVYNEAIARKHYHL